MDDLLPVRLVERIGDLAADVDDLADRQGRTAQPVREAGSLDVLHGDEGHSGRLADLVNRADVGMAEGRGGARLALEARQEGRITRNRQ